jgi:hypothetical protein
MLTRSSRTKPQEDAIVVADINIPLNGPMVEQIRTEERDAIKLEIRSELEREAIQYVNQQTSQYAHSMAILQEEKTILQEEKTILQEENLKLKSSIVDNQSTQVPMDDESQCESGGCSKVVAILMGVVEAVEKEREDTMATTPEEVARCKKMGRDLISNPNNKDIQSRTQQLLKDLNIK